MTSLTSISGDPFSHLAVRNGACFFSTLQACSIKEERSSPDDRSGSIDQVDARPLRPCCSKSMLAPCPLVLQKMYSELPQALLTVADPHPLGRSKGFQIVNSQMHVLRQVKLQLHDELFLS